MTERSTPRQRYNARAAALASDPTRPREAEVPMRDGIMLAADVYLPPGAAGPVPAVVQGTPYDKSHAMDADEAGMYQRAGYAFVLFDVRGRGKSEGAWRAFAQDGPDGADVIEWVASQAWCDGNVGMTGLSYGGWVVWATARERPPHLRAAVSSAAAGRWQEEIPYTFGVFQLYFAYWVMATRRRVMADLSQVDWTERLMRLPVTDLMESLGPVGETWPDMRDHDTLDAFWRALRLDAHYGQIELPVLHVAGWHDLEDQLGAFAHWHGMADHSPAAGRQRLIVGPWPHVGTRWPDRAYGGVDFGESAAIDMDKEHIRFFDVHLKGQRNGLEEEPPVRLFETGTNVWRAVDRFPLPHTVRPLHLRWDGAEGRLSQDAAASAEPARAYRYDPMDPVRTPLDFSKLSFDEPPIDLRYMEGRPDVLVYTGQALQDTLTVSGWPRVELWAATDGEDTDWHVKLTDVHPDGRSIRVSSGCLRAMCRQSLSDPTPVVPGAVNRYRIELGPVTHAFLPGHRVRLSVTSSDFPWFARNLNTAEPVVRQAVPRVATNTVCSAPGRESRLELPVVSGWR